LLLQESDQGKLLLWLAKKGIDKKDCNKKQDQLQIQKITLIKQTINIVLRLF